MKLPPAYWMLWTGTLINKLGGFVVTFLALYLTQARGLSDAQAGALVSLYGVGVVAASPVAGVLADRVGRRATMLASLVGGAIGVVALALVRDVSGLTALTAATGFMGEMYRPAASAMVADLVPPEQRERAYGLMYWAVNLGFAVAPVLGGLLAGRSFVALFIADAATTLLCAGIIFLRVPETHTRGAAGFDLGLAPFRDRRFVAFLLLGLALALVFNQSVVALPLDMAAHHISTAVFGRVIAVNGLLIIVAQPSLTRWLSRFPRARVLAAASLATGLGMAINALAGGALVYTLAVVVWTLGEIAWSPLAPAIIADLAPSDQRGRYLGAYGMIWGLAWAAGPRLGTEVLGRFGPRALWAGCLVLAALAAAGQLRLGHSRRT
jgi:MFS family permease